MLNKKILYTVTKFTFFGGIISAVGYFMIKSYKKHILSLQGNQMYYLLASQWVSNKLRNKNISEYLDKNRIKCIAIYGMGSLGELLYDEIKDSGVKVLYFIDKNIDDEYLGVDDIPVVTLDSLANQERVDAIIVTPVYDFEAISDILFEMDLEAEIISLNEIVYAL